MKTSTLFLCFLIYSFGIFANKELPEYGEIDKTDLNLKQCEFEKDAVAYELMSSGDVYYKVIDGDFNIVMERRIRIKILKEAGIDKANIKIRYITLGNYETVKNISGITYNLDSAGNVVTSKLDKESIIVKRLGNQFSEVSFKLPDAKVGSVIEYKFTKNKKSISNIDDWYFQDDIPTRISSYRVAIPAMFLFNSHVFADQDIKQGKDIVNEDAVYRKKHLQFSSQLRTYEVENVLGLRDEPFMGAATDYFQRVVFRLKGVKYGSGEKEELSATWPELTTGLLGNPDFGGEFSKKIPHTKKLDDLLVTATGDYKKMSTIYHFVANRMTWNGDRGIYPASGARQAWDKKKGNETDINFIVINLLRDQGIHAYPLLVSTKDNGTVNTEYPFLQQFNTTMVCAVIDDKKYILDAADRYNPVYHVPCSVLNNDAYIADNTNGGWIILSDNNNVLRNDVLINIRINPSDSLTGKAVINSYDYAKNKVLEVWGKDTSSFVNYYKAGDSLMQIKNIEVEGADMDSVAFEQKFDFAMPFTSKEGHDSFTVNFFQGFKNDPFVTSERNTDIDFNYKQSFKIEGTVAVPEGYLFSLPSDLHLAMPDSSIVLEKYFGMSDSVLSFRIMLNYKRSYYDAKVYPQLEEFYKKLYSALDEKIAFKKK
ncbi:MAG TPA: DUF3857 domain-containing protein [Hanamia sp.]